MFPFYHSVILSDAATYVVCFLPLEVVMSLRYIVQKGGVNGKNSLKSDCVDD